MNLLIWVFAFWLLTITGGRLFGLSPVVGWLYVALIVCLLGSYFYGETVKPIREKLREIDVRQARGEVGVSGLPRHSGTLRSEAIR